MRERAIKNRIFFIQRYEYLLIIDELQHVPTLMEVIESVVNKKRLEKGNAKGIFVLTGSQTLAEE